MLRLHIHERGNVVQFLTYVAYLIWGWTLRSRAKSLDTQIERYLVSGPRLAPRTRLAAIITISAGIPQPPRLDPLTCLQCPQPHDDYISPKILKRHHGPCAKLVHKTQFISPSQSPSHLTTRQAPHHIQQSRRLHLEEMASSNNSFSPRTPPPNPCLITIRKTCFMSTPTLSLTLHTRPTSPTCGGSSSRPGTTTRRGKCRGKPFVNLLIPPPPKEKWPSPKTPQPSSTPCFHSPISFSSLPGVPLTDGRVLHSSTTPSSSWARSPSSASSHRDSTPPSKDEIR